MDSVTEDRIKKVISEVFEMPVEKIDATLSVQTSAIWDSLHHMNLIIGLEKEFAIRLSDQGIVEMTNYGLVLKAVNEGLDAKKA